MPTSEWALFVGALMITMVITGTVIGRMPLSSAMVYLAFGWVLGPDVMNVLRPDPFLHASLLETISEAALLISLFAVGMQLGVPLWDRRWILPTLLATISVTLMVGMVAAVCVFLLHLSLGAGVLLGAILAPTDPVLASGVRSEAGSRPDRLGFSLAGEGGLNDGTAFPFVMLGLGLLGLEKIDAASPHWWGISVLWATLGGLAIGALLGTGTGRLVVLLRSRYGQAVGLDEFLGLGLVGMAYGLAQISFASGFLAVFAAGLGLQRVRRLTRLPAAIPHATEGEKAETARPRQAEAMQDTVQTFNEQLEKIAELALVLMLGAMLPFATLPPSIWWFVPLLLLVLRPVSVIAVVWASGLNSRQQGMIAWFGIRGIGSVFYLLFALGHGVGSELAEMLTGLTLWTVATSIFVHGLTAQPLMKRYLLWRRPGGGVR